MKYYGQTWNLEIVLLGEFEDQSQAFDFAEARDESQTLGDSFSLVYSEESLRKLQNSIAEALPPEPWSVFVDDESVSLFRDGIPGSVMVRAGLDGYCLSVLSESGTALEGHVKYADLK